MEKVQHVEFDPETYENELEYWLHQFQEENNLDLRAASQSVWNACMMYIQHHVFNNPDILKNHSIIQNANTNIPSNYNSYNYTLIDSICNYYIYICSLYDKEVSIMGFSKLTGISNTLISEWGNNYKDSNKLSKTSSAIYEKLISENEESLSAMLVSGKRNPVGVLGALNRRHNWNLPGVSKEPARHTALPAAELPKLSDYSGINTRNNVINGAVELSDNSE